MAGSRWQANAEGGVIAALFVETNGVYYGLPDVDPWDEARDARLYAGPWPVVAHPPCQRWSQMNRVNESRWSYKMGQDDGCFASALASVRKWGGVLEHPAESLAWPAFGLERPVPGAWVRSFDGDWVTEVRQSAYGHRAAKRTWLLYVGENPPALNWRPVRGTHQIGGFDVTLPQLPRRERAATPIAFRDLLISIARSAQVLQRARDAGRLELPVCSGGETPKPLVGQMAGDARVTLERTNHAQKASDHGNHPIPTQGCVGATPSGALEEPSEMGDGSA